MRAIAFNQRLQRGQAPSYQRLQAHLAKDGAESCTPQGVHCGWGRLLMGHTYPDAASLAAELQQERHGERDIALYVAAPQQVLAQAPQRPLPEAIIGRRKTGFGIPVARWLADAGMSGGGGSRGWAVEVARHA